MKTRDTTPKHWTPGFTHHHVAAAPYVLRYLPDVDLNNRKHALTDRRFETWVEAEDYRLTLPFPHRLEVVTR